MDKQNILTESTLTKNVKKRRSSARKPVRKRFTKPKKGWKGKSKVGLAEQQFQHDPGTKNNKDGNENLVGQAGADSICDDSDESCSNTETLDISGVEELSPNEDGAECMMVKDNNASPSSALSNDTVEDTSIEGALSSDMIAASNVAVDNYVPSPCPLGNAVPDESVLSSGDEESSFPKVVALSAFEMVQRCKDASKEDSPNVERSTQPIRTSTPSMPPVVPPSVKIRSIGQITLPPPTRALLEEVCHRLMTSLPCLWLPIIKDNGTHVGLCAENMSFVIQRSLFIAPDGTVSCTVHAKQLSDDHPFWKNVKKIALRPYNIEEFADNVLEMVHAFASLEMCPGVQQFEPFWKRAPNCDIDSNRFHEKNYNTTCRSGFCTLLYEKKTNKSRCDACNRVYRILSKRANRRSKKDTDSPAKSANHCFLNTSQQRKRLQAKNAQLRAERQRNTRLEERIAALLANEGLEVDCKSSDDVAEILENAKNTEGLTELQLLFIEQQLKAAKAKPRGMKWHPANNKVRVDS